MTTLQKVIESIKELGHTQYLKIDENSSFGETGDVQLNLDSLEMLELSVDLEVRTGVFISAETLGTFKTVKDIVDFIDKSEAETKNADSNATNALDEISIDEKVDTLLKSSIPPFRLDEATFIIDPKKAILAIKADLDNSKKETFTYFAAKVRLDKIYDAVTKKQRTIGSISAETGVCFSCKYYKESMECKK